MKTVKVLSFLLLVISVAFWSCEKKARVPKNIIVFISDGCGYNQIDAASMYQTGKTGTQVYEKFPVKFAMSTYPATGHGYDTGKAWKSFKYMLEKPTDSAASATALSCGVLTYNGALGVDTSKARLENITQKLESLGKATGVVSSVLFNHATPAGFVAHDSSRGNYSAIAREMILDSQADVVMGCGHPHFDDDGKMLSEFDYERVGQQKTWDKLVAGQAGGDADGDGQADPWEFIEKRGQFVKLMSGETPKRVFGLAPVRSTLQQGRSGDKKAEPFVVPFIESVPTLAEMTAGAINVLDDDPDGFFLMVEGGAIDWAGHGNQSGRVIEEEIDFNAAVQKAVSWVENNSNWDETLVVVTGDHETGYLWGPGSNPENPDSSLSIDQLFKPLVNNGKGKQPGMQWYSGGHSNSLIPFFAKGIGSDRFKKTVDGVDPVRGEYIDNSDLGQVMLGFYK